ncbi:MAG: alpha/beta fold hydrolase [Candidatus Promineifilaceae bacterium]|nr:alpha/beta fold hydrolase [Candidatus Promineifilaceae bacterium]
MTYPYAEYPRQAIDALGIKTSFVTAGRKDKRPIILLHGMTSSGDTYRELMRELENDFWLLAPDIPGFGYSDSTNPYTFPHLVEWLAAFREALDLPPAILAGHSFGGALAVNYALSYPEDVIGLLLIAPAILASDMYPTYLKRAGISLGLVDLSTAVSQSQAIVNQQIKLSFYEPDRQEESVWERRLRDYDLARASADVLKAVAFQELRSRLPDIEQPTCIIWGKDDPVLPVDHAAQLAALMKDIQVVEFDECGHIPMLEQATLCQAAVRAFLEGKDVPRAVESQRLKDTSQFNGPVISVFGSSAPLPGSVAYEEARKTGQLLANAGYAVATGGYSGTMAAVSQGAYEAGGHVIGVTCNQIEQFRPLGPNQWINEEQRYESLQDRLIHLVRQNDGMIVLPGGIGTLSEMSLAWSFLQVGEIDPRPLVLLGNSWRETMKTFYNRDYIRPLHQDLLLFVSSPVEAVAELTAARKRIASGN